MDIPPQQIPPSPPLDAELMDTRSLAIEGAKDIVFGSAAGIASKFFEHPFDLCKVRLQSQVLDHTARFNGPLDCLSQTFKNEGVRGLYRGLPAPVVGAMVENATLFLAYNQIQKGICWATNTSPSKELPLQHLALAAAGAGTITSFFLTPIELVKCKMQVQMLAPSPAQTGATMAGQIPGSEATLRKMPGPFGVLANVVRANGLRGLWLGQTGTLIREGGGSAAWFSTKEATCSYLLKLRSEKAGRTLTKKDLEMWESALSGAIAGISYNIALFPADTVKSALQTEEELRPRQPGVKGPTFFGMAREMYMKQGFRGLYAGCGITVARAIPSSAMIFLIYDGLSKHFS